VFEDNLTVSIIPRSLAVDAGTSSFLSEDTVKSLKKPWHYVTSKGVFGWAYKQGEGGWGYIGGEAYKRDKKMFRNVEIKHI